MCVCGRRGAAMVRGTICLSLKVSVLHAFFQVKTNGERLE